MSGSGPVGGCQGLGPHGWGQRSAAIFLEPLWSSHFLKDGIGFACLGFSFASQNRITIGSGDVHQMLNAVDVPRTGAMSDGFRGLDEVNSVEVFEVRAQVMKTVPNS